MTSNNKQHYGTIGITLAQSEGLVEFKMMMVPITIDILVGKDGVKG